MQDRITKDIRHGRFLARHGAGKIWNWESPAGKLRWGRHGKMLSGHLKLGMTILELEFWPFGLEQAGARWERLEMLRSLSMDLMLVTAKGVIPSMRVMFDAMSPGTLTFRKPQAPASLCPFIDMPNP
jgi:hypothetical protein